MVGDASVARWGHAVPGSGRGDLAIAWADRLERADTGGAIHLLPELRDAVLPVNFGIEVEEGSYAVAEDDDVQCRLQAKLIAPGDDDRPMGPAGINVVIDTIESCLEVEALEFPLQLQRRGFGRLVMAQLADLAEWLDVDEMKLEAGRTGRYAWARCGFNFLEPATECPRILDAAAAFAADLGFAVDLRGIEQPWQLAALPDRVPASRVQAAGGPSAGPNDEDWTLGKALLLGPSQNETSWYGVLDTQAESPDVVRLFRYVARASPVIPE